MHISVIMPAFNEGKGIGDALAFLTQSSDFGPDIEVIVAANGCTDDTAEVARSFDVRVLEIATPSKTAALNAADRIATGDVRVYVDADIPVTPGLIRQLAAAASSPGAAAATPRPDVDASASSLPVRAYYAVNARLPVFRGRLFGRGVIALSTHARRRFDHFPEITADDMFLDAIVDAAEKREIDSAVRVTAPRRTADLIRRIARARDGNDEFWRFVRSAPPELGLVADPVPGSARSSWLRHVVLPRPWLLPAAICYVAITLLAERKRRSPGWDVRSGWGRPAQPEAARVPGPRAATATEKVDHSGVRSE